MKTIEVCRKTLFCGKNNPLEIHYSITVDLLPDVSLESYGVQVAIPASGETCTIRHITCRADQIDRLIRLLSKHLVTPVTTTDVIEDWLAAEECPLQSR